MYTSCLLLIVRLTPSTLGLTDNLQSLLQTNNELPAHFSRSRNERRERGDLRLLYGDDFISGEQTTDCHATSKWERHCVV